MASKAALVRLRKEFKRLKKDPVENVEAVPLDSNILEWHYIVIGPKDSVYYGGIYHGKLVFPKDYPYKPPSIYMITPNGRFKINTRLCLSMSDFHPESWSPLWSVSSILSGLLSFMLENQSTYGSINTTDEVKRQYAANSMINNMKNPQFVKLFPHYVKKYNNNNNNSENEISMNDGLRQRISTNNNNNIQQQQSQQDANILQQKEQQSKFIIYLLIIIILIISIIFSFIYLNYF